MTCEIINVGTELLLGNILNTNAKYLAGQLQALGISCYHQTVVGDNAERLNEALKVALSRCDLVITTGGLGPTYDDITKQGVVSVLGLESTLDQASIEHCKAFYASAGKEFTDNNLQQAMMPVGAVVFSNDWGTANALAVEKDGKIVILLPGPPRELEPIFQKYVWPYLEKKTGDKIVKRKVRCFDVWEAHIEAKLRDLMTGSVNPSVAPYAGNGEVLLQVTARAKTEEEARAMTEPAIAQIKRTLQDNVYGVDVDSLEEVVVSLLRENKLTLAVAESCTGGLLAKRITDIPGASEVFLGGAVTYANELKTKLLGVKPETLEKYGAVSRQTAKEMAEGIQKITGATYALATTGIAGPGGGTKEKPVGLVYIGIATMHGTFVFDVIAGKEGSDRAYVRTLSCSHALDMLRKTISGLV